MAYIYENDIGRLGGNLQKTVAYLLSLHKAEYEWNLLGIKVVGHVDALPIPEGTYEYGDAYTVGTAAPYDMWIYTRADEFHSSAYWFNIGKFPAPGPQGPKGDGLETVVNWNTGTVQSVTYDTDTGATVETTAEIQYKDSTTGETKSQTFPCTIKLPMIPGKYISVDANSDGDAIEVKVDKISLEQDFYKVTVPPGGIVVPAYVTGTGQQYVYVTDDPVEYTLVKRDGTNSTSLRNLRLSGELQDPTNANYHVNVAQLYFATVNIEMPVDAASTDTGTLSIGEYGRLIGYPDTKIIYNNQTYYRMDPTDAPDGTLNYVHIDSVQDGNGGYKATGKCFSVTTSTRAWQVVDIPFVSALYKHDVFIRVNGKSSDSWVVKLVVTSSSPTAINSTTLSKYIYGGQNPDPVIMSGTPVNVYCENVGDSAGLGIGRIGYVQSSPNVSPTYLWEFTDIYHNYTLSGDSTQYTIERIVDTVTEV